MDKTAVLWFLRREGSERMNIELPKDAEGHDIPLDTKVLYTWDGSIRKVIKWISDPNKYVGWVVRVKTSKFEMNARPEFLYLTPPDTWEKLLEDLGRGEDEQKSAQCAYFDPVDGRCASCAAKGYVDCTQIVMRDVASRIRNLRGED